MFLHKFQYPPVTNFTKISKIKASQKALKLNVHLLPHHDLFVFIAHSDKSEAESINVQDPETVFLFWKEKTPQVEKKKFVLILLSLYFFAHV